MAQSQDAEIRYPDSLRTASGRLVRTSRMNPDTQITLPGAGHHQIRVRDIPMNAATLKCGRSIRGIMLRKGDLVFCEVHEKLERVAEVIA